MFVDDDEIELTPKEYAVLEYLMRHQGRVMSRTLITEYAWGTVWTRAGLDRLARIRCDDVVRLIAPLLDRQQAFGYTQEDLKIILAPMAESGEEAFGEVAAVALQGLVSALGILRRGALVAADPVIAAVPERELAAASSRTVWHFGQTIGSLLRS